MIWTLGIRLVGADPYHLCPRGEDSLIVCLSVEESSCWNTANITTLFSNTHARFDAAGLKRSRLGKCPSGEITR